VGMTRARKTLTVFDRADIRPSLTGTLTGPAVMHREIEGKLEATEATEATNARMANYHDSDTFLLALFSELA